MRTGRPKKKGYARLCGGPSVWLKIKLLILALAKTHNKPVGEIISEEFGKSYGIEPPEQKPNEKTQ